ncbi:molybdopterin-synthase adenylyltransferase MoeB [Otariodibacter oris]|nr:molybdopterin-synthase adenylyltransferase MoeB [Otariodibacter oris]
MRYSRQLLLQECGIEGQNLLKKKSVLIVGLGGLGSPVAQYLVGSGIGKVYLADFDKVDISNLPRQILYGVEDIYSLKAEAAKKRLNATNPDINVIAIPRKLDLTQLIYWASKVDVVLDCSDNMETRHQVNQACVQLNKVLVSGSAIGLSGQLLTITDYKEQGCYACLYPDQDLPNLNCKTAGVLAPIVGVIGCLQALETLKVLLNLPVSSAGKLMLFDGKNLTWQTLNLHRHAKCKICCTNH